MEVCKFLLAVSLAVTGGGGGAEPARVDMHPPKSAESIRITGGRPWTRSAGQRCAAFAGGHVLVLSQGGTGRGQLRAVCGRRCGRRCRHVDIALMHDPRDHLSNRSP